MIIFHSVVKTPLETFRRRVDFPYCTGLFLLIFALSWQITLCELQNMRCFYQPSPWKSLTGIIITFVLFFRSNISHARWKISLQETTLLLTSGLLITAGQRKSVLWSLERLVDFVFGCSRSLFFEDWSHILKGTMKIPSPEWSSKVLLLYRQILKRGKSLKYTDYDFFRRTIRREFEQQRDEVEIKVIKEQYEVLSHQFWNCSTVLLFWTLHHLFMFFLVNPHLIYGVHVHACHTVHPDS